MNIANIFGLHIGCKVKYDDVVNIIFGVSVAGVISIEPKPIRFNRCKLILKPLSKITDEDKAEFQVSYKIKEKVTGFDISSSGAVLVCTEFADFDGDPMDKYDDISYAQLVWLCSKGYDIGIIPDEYKEVEE